MVVTRTLSLRLPWRLVHNVNMSNRGGVQRGPGKTELRRYVEKGLTQQQIADAWEKESGHRLSRSAIGMALARFDLQSARPRPRYEDTLPWVVVSEHRMAYDARMLRLEGRRRRGGKLSEKEKHLLTIWREALDQENAVVTYDAATAEGFFWTPRLPEDDDILRRP